MKNTLEVKSVPAKTSFNTFFNEMVCFEGGYAVFQDGKQISPTYDKKETARATLNRINKKESEVSA